MTAEAQIIVAGQVQQLQAEKERLLAEEHRKAAQQSRPASIWQAMMDNATCEIDDLEIFYDLPTLRLVAGVVRKVKPSIILTHPPHDYMEDHTNTCRLAVTAGFTHGMPNFVTTPPSDDIYPEDVFIYHSIPHGLCDPLRIPAPVESFVDTSSVFATQREALAAHASQRDWLDKSQGADSYLKVLDETSLKVGQLSGRFRQAEGWRRHLHLGFSARDEDPLSTILAEKYFMREQNRP